VQGWIIWGCIEIAHEQRRQERGAAHQFIVQPGDAPTIGVAVVLCTAATVIGCLRPALRAARVDPIAALRSE